MSSPNRRRWIEKVEYVVVERDGLAREESLEDINATPTPTIEQIARSYVKRQQTSDADDSDDEDGKTTTSTTATPSSGGPPPLLITMTLSQAQATVGALAENEPMETVVVSLQPPPRPEHGGGGSGRISQSTEHLLIAAGSIGATIIVVMVILAIYTMRRRGLTFSDVVKQGKSQVRRRGGGTGSKYDWDNKQNLEQRYSLRNDAVYPPPPVARGSSRSGSRSSQTRVQPLARSDSFRKGSSDMSQQSFLLEDPPSRMNSHKRNSATPSSPILGPQGSRGSESTHNTRSMDDDDEYMQQQAASRQPAAPTFKQFMSNRPSISQRPGLGGMNSRFSWTNSQAPQTPHDPKGDRMSQPLGRDSFMTNRSSVPRFRTINSWVNQQSTRVEEQKLREQYRMTQSSTYSEDTYGDQVPEMPPVPKTYRQTGGLAGKDIKHQRHETNTSVGTAPVFKQHPGTEVRFSTRSTVPSEILDMGRKNSVLR